MNISRQLHSKRLSYIALHLQCVKRMLGIVEGTPGPRTLHCSKRTTRISARTTTGLDEPGLTMPTAQVCKTTRARESYLLWCTMHCYDPTSTLKLGCAGTPPGVEAKSERIAEALLHPDLET